MYYGDLNTTLSPRKPGLAGGLSARYNFNNRISLRSSLNFARIAGDDALSENNFERNRNLSFRSNIFDLTSGIEFNFMDYEHGSSDRWFTPFIFGGFSIFTFNPKAELNGNWYALRPLGTEGQDLGSEYGRISGGFTVGGGFKWDLNRDISFNIEFSTRRLFTDYIDDVSTVYPDQAELRNTNGVLAAELSDRTIFAGTDINAKRQRGNASDKDWYMMGGFTINWTLSKKYTDKCKPFRTKLR